MKIKLILLSMLITVMSYSQVKTFSAVNVIDSLSLGGSPYIDTIIDISNYQGNLQVDSVTANYIYLPNDTITGSGTSVSVTQLYNLTNTWERNGANLYPVGYTRVGIGTTTPNGIFEVADHIIFNNNYAETAIGFNAGVPNGYRNTFIGYSAGKNIDYADNVAIGSFALYNSVHVRDNIAIGSWVGYKNTGNQNIFIGYKTGYNNTGNYNIFNGYMAGYSNKSGSGNIFTGGNAGLSNTTGSYNIFSGAEAGSYNTTGNYNVFLGTEAGFQNVTGSYNVFLGNGAGNAETGSNKLYISNSNTTTPLIYGEFDNSILKIHGQLEVETTTGGFVVPRMTTTEINALTPINGMIVYNTAENKFYFYENNIWVTK